VLADEVSEERSCSTPPAPPLRDVLDKIPARLRLSMALLYPE
jgi:hypothetical protein